MMEKGVRRRQPHRQPIPAANLFAYCSLQVCQEVLVNGVCPSVGNVIPIILRHLWSVFTSDSRVVLLDVSAIVQTSGISLRRRLKAARAPSTAGGDKHRHYQYYHLETVDISLTDVQRVWRSKLTSNEVSGLARWNLLSPIFIDTDIDVGGFVEDWTPIFVGAGSGGNAMIPLHTAMLDTRKGEYNEGDVVDNAVDAISPFILAVQISRTDDVERVDGHLLVLNLRPTPRIPIVRCPCSIPFTGGHVDLTLSQKLT